MGWINTQRPRKSEFSSGYVWRVCRTIDGEPINIIKLEGICGSLLHIESSIVKLFHSCSKSCGSGNKLSCYQCLAIEKTMSKDGYDYRECISNGCWDKLSCSEVTE